MKSFLLGLFCFFSKKNSEPICKNVALYKLKVENVFDNIPDGEVFISYAKCPFETSRQALLREDWKKQSPQLVVEKQPMSRQALGPSLDTSGPVKALYKLLTLCVDMGKGQRN